ncbi:hypothetical protein ACQ4PT_005419 [Festuca glaucescens]
MAAAAATAAAPGALLPHALLNHRSPPPPQLLALSSSFRRISISASHRRTTHLIAHADAGAAEPEPSEEPAAETEAVVASADAEEGEAEAAVAVAEEEEEPAPKRKPKFGEIIAILNKQFIEEAEKVKVLPDLRPGDIIELRMQRPNKRRLSLFKGIIIAKHKSGVHTTIRVRRIIAGVGVEITFPMFEALLLKMHFIHHNWRGRFNCCILESLYSPRIKEIKVIRRKKVRRAKLYYLKHKLPRFSTFK